MSLGSPGSGVVVRARAAADLGACAAIAVAVHDRDGYPVEGLPDARAWLSSPELLSAHVAEVDGRIAGHVALARPGPACAAPGLWHDRTGDPLSSMAVLTRFLVDPGVRRRGAGAALVEAAVADAQDRGLRVLLDVVSKDLAAVRLYQRLGWDRFSAASLVGADGRRWTTFCYVAPAADKEAVLRDVLRLWLGEGRA